MTGRPLQLLQYLHRGSVQPMASLEAFRGGHPRRTWQTSPDSWQNPASQLTVGRSSRKSQLYCNYRPRIAPCTYWNGHHAYAARPDRCHQRHRCARAAGPKYKTSLQPASLCCYKPSTSPPRQRALSVAITHGPARMSTFAQKKACPRLCPECLLLPVDLKHGSRSTTTAPNRSACTPGKLWVP